MSFVLIPFLLAAAANPAELASSKVQNTIITGGELRFAVPSEPKSLHPLQVSDESGELVRYLTSGSLIRLNRASQKIEPELAESWKLGANGAEITFQLRKGLKYSDGTPFDAADVVFTINKLLDKTLVSPVAESFRPESGTVEVKSVGPAIVLVKFPVYIAGVERLFAGLSILSSRSPKKEWAGLGPFTIAESKAGSFLRLARNPNYWKKDSNGRQLPYLDAIRIEFQRNRDIEILRFQKGEFDLVSNLEPEAFEKLKTNPAVKSLDLGTSLDTQQLWFNQTPASPMSPHKKEWFKSQGFRRAVSEAINRKDMARVVYHGYGVPAAGPISPSNSFWFANELKAPEFQPKSALARLQKEGFRLDGEQLKDKGGNPVEFTIVTNAGNKVRERLAAMIQADLRQIGIKVTVAVLDFPSLIERIMRTFNYEACLLGSVNLDLDPSDQMNVWLSSGSSHAWNPNQKTPATAWEADIDKWMRLQAREIDPKKRKAAFDKVQVISAQQSPIIYLINKRTLAASSHHIRNLKPAILPPHMIWNVEEIYFADGMMRAAK
jgi:peptide/nickel transport system substrate-binding protein